MFWTFKWVLPERFCKKSQGIINFGGIFALSLFTIIALDRYLISKTIQLKSFQSPLCFWIWLGLLFLIASVIPVLVDFNVSKDGVYLGDLAQRSSKSLIYLLYLLIGTFVTPMIFISYFYYCVIKTVRENMVTLRTASNNIALLQIVLVFPNRIVWVIVNIIAAGNMPNSAFRTVKYFALFPYLFHISVNPLIYSFVDKVWRANDKNM